MENLALPGPAREDAPDAHSVMHRRWIAADDPSLLLGLIVVVLFLAVMLFAPWLEPYRSAVPSCGVFERPSPAHWFGCDDGGFDMASLVIEGGRVSILVGIAAATIAIVLGALIGTAAGYFGGWIDGVLMSVTDYVLVFPQVVVMIVVAALWGAGLSHVVLAIAMLLWANPARLVRAQVSSLRGRLFIRRVRATGGSHFYIIRRHILPELGPMLLANAVLAVTSAIFSETALAFLGLSDANAVTWGTIIEHAFDRAAISAGAWWAVVPAGLAIACFVTGTAMVGRSLESRLNARTPTCHLNGKVWRLRSRLK